MMFYPGFFYFRPEDIFNSEWFRFAIVFILFYAIIFYSLNRVFKENRATAIIVSVIASLVITFGFIKQGLLNHYVGSDFAAFLVILGFLIVFGFIFKILFEHAKPAAILLLLAIWFVLFMSDPYNALPYFMHNDIVIRAYEILASWIGLVLLIVVGLLSLGFGGKKHKLHLRTY